MFNSTLDKLRELGATIIDPADIPSADTISKLPMVGALHLPNTDWHAG